MATFRQDPYLWLHLAGAATLPLWFALVLLGLGVGYPTHPTLELGVIIVAGVLPALWMQVKQPFYIFSLLLLTLKPASLTPTQRRLLALFHRWWHRAFALLVPVPLVWLLVQLYPLSPLAAAITPFEPWGRLAGLAIATLSFGLANLFLQVPVAVLLVLATPSDRFQTVDPYALEAIATDFTLFPSLKLGRLLPGVRTEAPTPSTVLPAEPSMGDTQPPSP
jgi:hypothetical protein